ncbi:hypothetical protein CPA40_11355, partial [Bifidobacterium callitrichos]
TSTTSTSGGWTDEGRLFEGVDSEVNGEFADFDAAADTDGTKGLSATEKTVRDQLAAAATPIVTPVYRLFNKVNGDHV